jgi:hypothetical protein
MTQKQLAAGAAAAAAAGSGAGTCAGVLQHIAMQKVASAAAEVHGCNLVLMAARLHQSSQAMRCWLVQLVSSRHLHAVVSSTLSMLLLLLLLLLFLLLPGQGGIQEAGVAVSP